MCVFLDRIVKKKKKNTKEKNQQSIYASLLVVEPKWQKLCTSRIALSRTLTWLARVNSEKKQAESASLQCDHWETSQRSNCSTCTNTRAKTQCRQLPHTHKHCILHKRSPICICCEYLMPHLYPKEHLFTITFTTSHASPLTTTWFENKKLNLNCWIHE